MSVVDAIRRRAQVWRVELPESVELDAYGRPIRTPGQTVEVHGAGVPVTMYRQQVVEGGPVEIGDLILYVLKEEGVTKEIFDKESIVIGPDGIRWGVIGIDDYEGTLDPEAPGRSAFLVVYLRRVASQITQ